MLRMIATVIAASALAACTTASETEKESTAGPAEMSGLEAVSVASIVAARKAPVEDQFITCVQDTGNGNSYSQFYLIKDGAVKSYSKIQNYARPMCDPGQPGCALGWQGEQIALFFETASGAVNQMLLDLDTMTQRKLLTTASKGAEESIAQCTSGPYPEGVRID